VSVTQPPFDPYALLAAIVTSSDDAIVSKTFEGIITSWNLGAERMFGYTAAEAIGQSILLIIPPDRISEEEHVLSRIRSGLSVDHFETVRRRKDGTLIDISLTVSPVRSSSGEIVGASKIARDISEQRRLRRELEAANRAKDDFLATLSHELRTPLNAILGYAQIMRRNLLGDEGRRRQAVEIIERNARALAQLVSDVVEVSRIVAGKIRLEVQPCDVAQILALAIDSVGPSFAAKQIHVDRDIDPAAGYMMGDPERLQQMFWNLLTNAAKFTPTGGQVVIRLARLGDEIEVSVHDNGIGISPAFLPHIFERFRQADSSPTRQFGGLGLGLAIVRHFTELHGGQVRAHSDGPGTGATFRITLPGTVQRSGWPAGMGGDDDLTATTSAELHSIVALAVDDDADSLRLVRDSLQSAGAEVLCAHSAREALALLQARRPDVIIADIGMPDIDGWELITRVRRQGMEEGRLIPAAALSAYASPEDRRRSLRSGFQLHLTKPVKPAELVRTVAELVKP